MIVTEDQALEMYCFMTFNNYGMEKCCGVDCMGWVWIDNEKPEKKSDRKGCCNVAYKKNLKETKDE